MPIYESTRKPRERWPLAFDLEGVPRDNTVRRRLVEQRQQQEALESFPEETKAMPQPSNVFTVDAPVVVDINQPPRVHYNPREPQNEFPKMLYRHDSGHVLVIEDAKQEKAALKKGFSPTPAPGRDYSKVKSGMMAPMKAAGPVREQGLSAEDLATLEEAGEAT